MYVVCWILRICFKVKVVAWAKFYIAIIIPKFQNKYILPPLHGANRQIWLSGSVGIQAKFCQTQWKWLNFYSQWRMERVLIFTFCILRLSNPKFLKSLKCLGWFLPTVKISCVLLSLVSDIILHHDNSSHSWR